MIDKDSMYYDSMYYKIDILALKILYEVKRNKMIFWKSTSENCIHGFAARREIEYINK
jgi:hypothetical protein